MVEKVRRLLLLWVLLALASPLLPAQSSKLAEQSNQARDLMAAGKFEQAIPIYRELVQAVPGNAGLVTNLGLAYHMAGHEQQAVTELTHALKLESHNVPAHLYLGYA